MLCQTLEIISLFHDSKKKKSVGGCVWENMTPEKVALQNEAEDQQIEIPTWLCTCVASLVSPTPFGMVALSFPSGL